MKVFPLLFSPSISFLVIQIYSFFSTHTRHSVVGILTTLRDGCLWDPDSIPGMCKRMISFPKRTGRL